MLEVKRKGGGQPQGTFTLKCPPSSDRESSAGVLLALPSPQVPVLSGPAPRSWRQISLPHPPPRPPPPPPHPQPLLASPVRYPLPHNLVERRRSGLRRSAIAATTRKAK